MSSFDYKGRRVYYRVVGQGRPLVLLNGIMMTTRSWHPFVEAFQAGGHRLVLVDLLDQGRTDAFEEGYTLKNQADMVWALLDDLGHQQIHLLGTSYGGALALQMTVDQPDRVDKLLLAAARCWTDPLFEDMLESWLHARHGPAAFYTATMGLYYGATFQQQHRDWLLKQRALLERALFQKPDFLSRMGRLIRSIQCFDLRPRLSAIRCPTLILAAEEDLVMTHWTQELLAQGIPHSQMVILPRTGHIMFVEQPDLFAQLVTGFFTHTQPIRMP